MFINQSFPIFLNPSPSKSLSRYPSESAWETPRYLETAIAVVGLRDSHLLSILCTFLNRLPGQHQRQRVVLLTALHYAERDTAVLDWMLQTSKMMRMHLIPWFKRHLKKFFNTLEFTPEGGQQLIHGSTRAELNLVRSLLRYGHTDLQMSECS